MDFEIRKLKKNSLSTLVERFNKTGINSGWILDTGEAYYYV